MEILQNVAESWEAVRYKLVGVVWSCRQQCSQGIDAGILCLLRITIPEAYPFGQSSEGRDMGAYTATHARELPIPSSIILPERNAEPFDKISTISDEMRRRVASGLFR